MKIILKTGSLFCFPAMQQIAKQTPYFRLHAQGKFIVFILFLNVKYITYLV